MESQVRGGCPHLFPAEASQIYIHIPYHSLAEVMIIKGYSSLFPFFE